MDSAHHGFDCVLVCVTVKCNTVDLRPVFSSLKTLQKCNKMPVLHDVTKMYQNNVTLDLRRTLNTLPTSSTVVRTQ